MIAPDDPRPRLVISGPYAVDPRSVPMIEEAKNCFYIGSSAIPVSRQGIEAEPDKGWSYDPLDIFWSPLKHPTSDSHMFGLYRRDGKIMIRDVNKFDGIVQGVFIPAYNILSYSTYRHDFFCPLDKLNNGATIRVCVDGGRDYLRVLGNQLDYESVMIDLTDRQYWRHDTPNIRLDYVLETSAHNE